MGQEMSEFLLVLGCTVRSLIRAIFSPDEFLDLVGVEINTEGCEVEGADHGEKVLEVVLEIVIRSEKRVFVFVAEGREWGEAGLPHGNLRVLCRINGVIIFLNDFQVAGVAVLDEGDRV